MTGRNEDRGLRYARLAGALAIGAATGALLALAAIELYGAIGQVSAFKYQGF